MEYVVYVDGGCDSEIVGFSLDRSSGLEKRLKCTCWATDQG